MRVKSLKILGLLGLAILLLQAYWYIDYSGNLNISVINFEGYESAEYKLLINNEIIVEDSINDEGFEAFNNYNLNRLGKSKITIEFEDGNSKQVDINIFSMRWVVFQTHPIFPLSNNEEVTNYEINSFVEWTPYVYE